MRERGDLLFRSLPVGATEPQGYLVPGKQRNAKLSSEVHSLGWAAEAADMHSQVS